MAEWLGAVGVGSAAFVATNIDDIFLLTALFAARHLRTRAVVLGQFAGIAVLVLVSVVAARLALAISSQWLALLGLAPLWLGLMELRARWRGEDDNDDDTTALQRGEQAAEQRWHSQIVAVAAITIANGGDNLGVYIPLFAHAPTDIFIYVVVFALLTGLWCALGYVLVTHRVIGAQIQRIGHALLPFVLIALGLYILISGWHF